MWLRILRQLTILFSSAHHRFSIRFGEDRSRMSSMHSIVEVPAGKRGLIMTAIPKALFGLPTEYSGHLKRFGWTILFIALLGVSMYPGVSKTGYRK